MRSRRRPMSELLCNWECPLPGLVPGIHVLAVEITMAHEDVDAHGSSPWAEGPRVKPGQGDLLLFMNSCKQLMFLSRTAVGIHGQTGQSVPGFRGCPEQVRA
jgi:hypothetical protein